MNELELDTLDFAVNRRCSRNVGRRAANEHALCGPVLEGHRPAERDDIA